jgi:undecaprenyl-diphosphatase
MLVAPFALLVASSRLVLGLHYPSDVVFGALIGGGVAWASFLFLN